MQKLSSSCRATYTRLLCSWFKTKAKSQYPAGIATMTPRSHDRPASVELEIWKLNGFTREVNFAWIQGVYSNGSHFKVFLLRKGKKEHDQNWITLRYLGLFPFHVIKANKDLNVRLWSTYQFISKTSATAADVKINKRNWTCGTLNMYFKQEGLNHFFCMFDFLFTVMRL